MPKKFTGKGFTIIHTDGANSSNDLSFLRTIWSEDSRKEKLQNLDRICQEDGLSTKYAILRYSNLDDDEKIRVVVHPDEDLLNPLCCPSNTIMTNRDDITLVAIAADDCLVGLVAPGRHVRAIVHVSPDNLKLHAIQDAVDAMYSAYGIMPSDLVALIGACTDMCCTEYEVQRVVWAFDSEFTEFVQPLKGGKDTFALDLRGAVRHALYRAGVNTMMDLYDPASRCTVCAKRDGAFLHYSAQRMAFKSYDGSSFYYNGEYAMILGSNDL